MSACRIERLGNGPLIVPNMDERMGANINGPSLVRVPDWAPNRLGNYYLYFSHHNGDYIRLAVADEITGPYRIYSPGSLQHAQSYFPAEIDPLDSSRLPPGIVTPIPHIASPDVHVDDALRRFRMYYHGILRDRTQVTRVATSEDGIAFTGLPAILGRSYWRAFEHGGWHYGLAMPGVFYRSRDPLGPFEQGPTLFGSNQRHTAVMLNEDTLTVFYTNVGEEPPECILVATIDLSGDWLHWEATAPSVLLQPERAYEGADLPLVPSIRGEATQRARQLRDPAVYVEGASAYLLYSVSGESGIAIGRLQQE